MKIRKIIIILIFISLLIIPSSANGPPPQSYLHVRIINMPEDAVYADVLIQIKETDKRYTEIDKNNFKKFNISEESEIVKYKEDGYKSFTFHYKNAQSMINIYSRDKLPSYLQEEYTVETGYVNFAYDPFDTNDIIFYNQFNDLINDFSNIKFVITDKEGKILSISDETNLAIPKPGGYLYGWQTYDASNGAVEVNKLLDYTAFSVISILGVLLTIILETLTAMFLKMRPFKRIVLVNLISQVIMRVLAFISPFQYIFTLIILEVLVYTSEYTIYIHLYKELTKRKIFIFTITANTLSLVVGFIFNHIMYNI